MTRPPAVMGHGAPLAHEPRAVAPTALRLLSVWARIGLQSFGGGQAVQLYAYRDLVDTHEWVTPEAWAEDWGICQMVPGVNLIAFAVLVGNRLAGLPGAAASVAGLLVPSVTITVIMAAAYERVRELQFVRSAVHGMLLAAAGGSFVVALRLTRPLLRASSADGTVALASAVLLLPACALLVLTGEVPVVLVLVGGGCATAAALWVNNRRRARGSR